jgi:glycosyltransferase involved in cell wall biosynthesis
VAALSYWFLSPSFLLALAGQIRGWEETEPTPVRSWRTATVDAIVPAYNEESTIALALESLTRQDFPLRQIIVVDDASTDRTAEVVRRYAELSSRNIVSVRRNEQMGKTPAIREICQQSDTDVLFVLDADTVLMDSNYVSRSVEELFRNAGVASVCGQVMPLQHTTLSAAAHRSMTLAQLSGEFAGIMSSVQNRWTRLLIWFTIVYRTALYLFLSRLVYDGHLKLLGGTLNPAGCAVAYRRDRLAECFAYAQPKIGDNLSSSEDIYIGHFFNWKGYRNVHISAIRCESAEPPVTRLWRQLFLWSSSFFQSSYYFPSLPLTVLKWRSHFIARLSKRRIPERRQAREQYRAPWGEGYTKRYGRPIGLISCLSLVEKVTFPAILLGLMIFYPDVALLSLLIEILISAAAVAVVSDSGARLRGAAMMIAATPIRLMSMIVDVAAMTRFALDMAIGQRNWRK